MTEDAGETWTQVHAAPDEEKPLFAVWFENAERGIAVGAYSALYRTGDGGRTWQPVPAPEGDRHFNALAGGADGKVLLVGESGLILRSDDAGRTWRTLDSPYKGSWFGVLRLGDGGWLAFGLRGNVFRSNDDGESWSPVNPAGAQASLMGGTLLPAAACCSSAARGRCSKAATAAAASARARRGRQGARRGAVAAFRRARGGRRGRRGAPGSRRLARLPPPRTERSMAWNKSEFDRRVASIANPALRRVLLAVFVVLTALLVWSATHLKVDAGFNKMVPLEHEYMRTFTEYRRPSAAPTACWWHCASRAPAATSIRPSSCAR